MAQTLDERPYMLCGGESPARFWFGIDLIAKLEDQELDRVMRRLRPPAQWYGRNPEWLAECMGGPVDDDDELNA